VGALQREAPDCVFVNEAITSEVVLWDHLDLDQPGTLKTTTFTAVDVNEFIDKLGDGVG
jgi:hypothetical protein